MSIAIPKTLQAMYCVCDFFHLEKGNISHEIGFFLFLAYCLFFHVMHFYFI